MITSDDETLDSKILQKRDNIMTKEQENYISKYTRKIKKIQSDMLRKSVSNSTFHKVTNKHQSDFKKWCDKNDIHLVKVDIADFT